jgi:Skp family chaperone for outer membrane proteins
MFKKILFILSFVLLSANSFAEEILVVDIEYIISNSKAAVDVAKQLKVKQEEYQEQISKQEDSLKKDEEKLKKEQKTLSAKAFDKKLKNFQTRLAEFQRGIQMKKQDLDNINMQSISIIGKKANEIISKVATERKAKIVIPTSQVLYALNNLDITKQIAIELDKKLPKLDIKQNVKK